jgi:hypothetical protein
MVRAELRAVLEDSSSGDVIVEAEGGSVRAAVAALFEISRPRLSGWRNFILRWLESASS